MEDIRCNYRCKVCNNEYKTYQTLWVHNKIKHPIFINDSNHERNHERNHKYKCSKCDKYFIHRQNRWRHEQTCNKIIQPINNKQIINNINNQQIINNHGTINNDNRKIINLKLIIKGVGTENIKDIPIKDVQKILLNISSGRSILDYVKAAYFNKELPENHSFCCTNIKSKYLKTINPETNKPILDYKLSFYDNLTHKVIDRIDELHKEYINEKFIKNNKDSINDLLNNNSSFKEKVTNDKLVKWLFGEYEKLAYNNKDLIRATWNGYNNNYPIIRKINKLINEIKTINIVNNNILKKNNLIINKYLDYCQFKIKAK
jgi:hypothetical protein